MAMRRKARAKTAQAKRRAIANYDSKFSFIRIRLTPEEKELIKSAAAEHGKSMNGFVKETVLTKIKRIKK